MDNTIFQNIAKRSLDFDRFRHYEFLIFQKKFLYVTKYLPIVELSQKTEVRKVICTKFYGKSKILPIFTDFGQFSTFYEIGCDVIAQICKFSKFFFCNLVPLYTKFLCTKFQVKTQTQSWDIEGGFPEPPPPPRGNTIPRQARGR